VEDPQSEKTNLRNDGKRGRQQKGAQKLMLAISQKLSSDLQKKYTGKGEERYSGGTGLGVNNQVCG